MAGYVEGVSRDQATLFPERLDDLITADAQVRVVDLFVNRLDLGLLEFTKSAPLSKGRPPYDPADLLKLYVYGYLHQVRSSRQLERECRRNIEVLWLLNKLAPDFKTIADFRRDNRKAIGRVCRWFVQFCRGQGLFGAELVAIDGSKFAAQNSPQRAYTVAQIEQEAKRLDERIGAYLAVLDSADADEGSEEIAPGDTRAALALLQERRAALPMSRAQGRDGRNGPEHHRLQSEASNCGPRSRRTAPPARPSLRRAPSRLAQTCEDPFKPAPREFSHSLLVVALLARARCATAAFSAQLWATTRVAPIGARIRF